MQITFLKKSGVKACLCSLLISVMSLAQADYKIIYTHPPETEVSTLGVHEDLWNVLKSEFSLNHEASRSEVKEQIAWLMGHRKYLRIAAQNARPYLYYILQQIKKRHLPAEFALLPIIESAYDPYAYSTAGASGLWQMMPATANDFGLKQNWWYDGRRDVVASTNAALNYLVYLQNFFNGNWLFVVAAYHTGQGTVLSAIKKNAAKGDSTDFWSLPLGQQTQIYIPKLLALAEMMSHPEKYPLDLPPIPDAPYLTQIDVGSQIDLAKAAELSGLSLSALKKLNPGFSRWATAPDGPFVLVVPIQNEARLREGLALLPHSHRVTWQRYDVKSGDTLSKIATKFHTTTAMLQQINKLDSTLLQVGDVLFIPNSSVATSLPASATTATSKPISVAKTTSVAKAKPVVKVPEKITYTVRNGDTLGSIAHRYHLGWESLKAYNHLKSNDLHIGQKIQIPPKATSTNGK